MDSSGNMVMRGSQRYMVEAAQGTSQGRYLYQDSVRRYNTGAGSTLSVARNHSSPAPRVSTSGRLVQTPSAANCSPSLKRSFMNYHYDFNQRFAKGDGKSKGLRHFSTKVCEKVKEKGRTNYNEVADELVSEYFDSVSAPMTDVDKQSYDMKNIRRRVYDALNVLMAMNIIDKEKKEIRWVGLPTSSLHELRRLQEEKQKRIERIKEKTETLHELIVQLVAYKALVERNREREREEGRPRDNSILYLPYVIVSTDKKTNVECNISSDKCEYVFNLDKPFEIQDDIEVLKRLGLALGMDTGDVADDIRPSIKEYLPAALRSYVDPIIDNVYANRLHQQTMGNRMSYDKKHSGNRQIMRGGTVNRIVPPGSSMPSSSSTQGRFRIEGAPTSSSSDNRFFATNRSSTVPGFRNYASYSSVPKYAVVRHQAPAYSMQAAQVDHNLMGNERFTEMMGEEEENDGYE